MTTTKRIHHNITKIYLLSAVRGSMVHVPVYVLFLQSNGLTLYHVFLTQAWFSIIQLVLEIPSGYLSDRWGRKPTTILGTFSKAAGAGIMCLGSNFWMFLGGITLLATGSSLYSGTVEALLYDSLLEEGKEEKYREIEGHRGFIQFGTEAVASILGGLLALIALRASMIATFCFFCIGPFIAVTLVEPQRHKIQETRHLRAMWEVCKDAIIHKPAIRSIIALNSVLLSIAFGLYWFTQPYQELVGLPLALFGVMHMIIVATHAIASKYTHALQKYIDDRLFLFLISIGIVGSFLALGTIQALWALVFFILVRMCWGFLFPLTSDMLNRMTTSDVRATVLSIRSFGFRGLFTILSPVLGYWADIFSLQEALLMTGALSAVVIGVIFLLMRRVWSDIPR